MLKLTTFNSPTKRGGDWFDTFFDDFFDFKAVPKNTSFKLDVKEDEGNYIIEADIPGVNKEDVKISYENDHLYIGVEKKEENVEEAKNYLHRERSYSSMQRSIYLPNLDANKVKAKLDNGVLKLTLEKKAIEKKGHLIEIE